MTHMAPSPHEAAITPWWQKTYPELARDLGFSQQEDHAAAMHLDHLVRQHVNKAIGLESLQIGEKAVVAGAADTLRVDLEERPLQPDESLIVADGAIRDALGHATPALIVTDLDGDPPTLERLNAQGIPLAVHAHGDNRELLDEWIPRLKGPILPTRQTPGERPEGVLCPGGFADGDRAVLLAAHAGAQAIRLVGFDLLGEPGKASPTQPEKKRRKMHWSARILQEAAGLGIPIDTRHL